MPVALAAALLLQCYAVWPLPMAKSEDSSLEQDALAALLSDEVADNALAVGDLETPARTRGPRLIVVAEPSLWRELSSGLSLIKRRAEADGSQMTEHRGASHDLSLPILRRDTMRCMVGRVYRPCWEV